MNIIPIKFTIAIEDLTKASTEDVEQSIKNEIIAHISESISPMLDSEDFVSMTPSEDGSQFNIEINLMIGSANEYIDATQQVIHLIVDNCKKTGVTDSIAKDVAANVTKPLISLVK